MKRNATAQESGWRVSCWFAVASPLLGVLLAFLAAAIFADDQEAMSITLIICILVILLFGFDLTGEVKIRRQHNHG